MSSFETKRYQTDKKQLPCLRRTDGAVLPSNSSRTLKFTITEMLANGKFTSFGSYFMYTPNYFQIPSIELHVHEITAK